MDEKNVPKLRFPGFTDAWEQRKLGKLFDFHYGDGNNNPSNGGKYPVYGAGGVQGGYTKYNAENSIIIGHMGDAGCVSWGEGKHFVTYNGTITKPKNDVFNAKFGYYLLLQMNLRKNRGGSGLPFLTYEMLTEMDTKCPISTLESSLISDFFSEIDHLIALQKAELEKHKRLKSAMLQKMFPREGESVPELRFPGFTGEWERRKLSELCDKFTDGDWIEAKEQSDSGVRLIQTGNVGTTEYIDKLANAKWVSFETFERLHCEEIFAGDMLISRLPEPAGRACIVPNLGTKMITAVDCTIVRLSPQYDSKFLVQYLSTQAYFDKVNTCLAGGTRQRISRGNLADFQIPVPKENSEQKAIGAYFSNLDNLIALHQRELEKLTKLKQGLLQQMFV